MGLRSCTLKGLPMALAPVKNGGAAGCRGRARHRRLPVLELIRGHFRKRDRLEAALVLLCLGSLAGIPRLPAVSL